MLFSLIDLCLKVLGMLLAEKFCNNKVRNRLVVSQNEITDF